MVLVNNISVLIGKVKPFMVSFKRTLAIMHFDLSQSHLEQASKDDLFDKEVAEWMVLDKAANWKKEVTKQRQLLHLLAAGPKAAGLSAL